MTSISGTSSSWQQYSPSQLLQNQIQQDVSSGQISSTDQTALTSAIDQIQTSLQQDTSSTAASSTSADTSSTTPPSADDLQTKISSLIDNQVSAGTLTSSQASELKDVFKQTFGADGSSGTTTADSSSVKGHHGGHGHHHGAPPVDDADTDSDTDSSTSTTVSAATLGSSSTTPTSADSTQQLVDQFLQSLQAQQSTNYSAAGTTGSSNLSSFLMNITA